MKLTVTERYHAAVVAIRGAFYGGHDGPALRETLAVLRATDRTRVVLDLAGVTHIDTCSVGVLLDEAQRQRLFGGDLRLAGVEASPRTFALVTLTGLREALACFATAEEAHASFAVEAPLALAA